MENETKRYTGAELKVGMTAERTKTITTVSYTHLSGEARP